MEYGDYIKRGPSGKAPLELILCGDTQNTESEKVGTVSVVYVANDKDLAEQRVNELTVANPNNYCMAYNAPLNVNLTELSHYLSMTVFKSDL